MLLDAEAIQVDRRAHAHPFASMKHRLRARQRGHGCQHTVAQAGLPGTRLQGSLITVSLGAFLTRSRVIEN